MATNPADDLRREERLNEILAEYLEAVDAGQHPDPQEWLKKYPDFMTELVEFLANQEQIEQLAVPLRDVARAADVTPTVDDGTTPQQSPAPGVHIRYFGDYELLEEIARGGMGVVFKARQVSLNRIVALKMILTGQLASPADVQRFRTEAEAAANLDHPNIVPIHEVGEHDGQHYFTMKYVDGGSLAKVRGEAIGTTAEGQHTAAKLVEQVVRAVHYAHQRGILHRDLKPANILLSFSRRSQSGAESSRAPVAALVRDERLQDAVPMVTDFGLAKRLITEPDATTEQPLTATGAAIGTPSYMSPEQAAGRRDAITVATDVYSLGAILYELLTGRPPFQGTNQLETLRMVTESDPVPPRQLVRSIDRSLEAVCLECLEKDPRRRYESAARLALELHGWSKGEPVSARHGNAWDRARRRLKQVIGSGRLYWITLAFVAIWLLSSFFHFGGLGQVLIIGTFFLIIAVYPQRSVRQLRTKLPKEGHARESRVGAMALLGGIIGALLAGSVVALGYGLSGGNVGARELLKYAVALIPGGTITGMSAGAVIALILGSAVPRLFAMFFCAAVGWTGGFLIHSATENEVESPLTADLPELLLGCLGTGMALGFALSRQVQGFGLRSRRFAIRAAIVGSIIGIAYSSYRFMYWPGMWESLLIGDWRKVVGEIGDSITNYGSMHLLSAAPFALFGGIIGAFVGVEWKGREPTAQ